MTNTTGMTMFTASSDWRPFLLSWSGEWADSLSASEPLSEDDEAARRTRWLGAPPASEERITAMESGLGVRMPPSYREFLKASDGWRHAGWFVSLLAGTAQVRWHDDESGLAEVFEECLDEDAGPEERREADLWRRGLQLDVESDATYVLMDPEDVDEDGEWAVYTWAGWRAAPPHRYANFAEFMRHMHREYHNVRAHRGDEEPEFVNDTTRELDARVEQARLDALRGDWEGAGQELDEAVEYGRPRAAGLRGQLHRLLAPSPTRHVTDVVTAQPAPEQTADGTGRPAPADPFEEAVVRARESARWGDTDGAWRTLMAALPQWTPQGPDDVAPLDWLDDPLLEPLLTPERARELLSTPRGGQVGVAPTPTPDLDPGDLAWLADTAPHDHLASYRFVLVEGVPPQELPGRLADGDAAKLDAPMTSDEARYRLLRGKREFSSYDDQATVAVGRAGSRWSFAFDGDPAHFEPQRFVSPAAAASAGTRAVVVWSSLKSWRGEPFCHLSVAQDGVEQYAFTYEDGELRRSGEIPPALDPGRFVGTEEDGAPAERALLEAVSREFDVHLPRRALTDGRLHGFTTRSWTRPPQDGEGYVVIGRNGHTVD